MGLDFAATARVVSFLDIRQVSFDDIESTLAVRLSALLEQDLAIFFSCPLTSDTAADKEEFLIIDSAVGSSSVKIVSTEYLRTNEPSLFTRIMYFDEFDEDNILKPKIIIKLSQPLQPDHIPVVEKLVRSFMSSMLRRQYATMRRAIINAKIDSDDLGSFLHRLFKRHSFHKLLSAEAASVFVLDHRNTMLHLRGTTGLASDVHMSDISFHIDEDVNVGTVFRSRKPKIEFKESQTLALGRSGESTSGGQFIKAYWPLQVRTASSPKASTHSSRPCMGVMRIVNYANSNIQNGPFTWMPLCCLVYAAESLYNVTESFVATDHASFNKEAAFHGSQSVVDTIAKNIDIVRRAIFQDIHPQARDAPAFFNLVPRENAYGPTADQLKIILNTAYASARALGFQIDRVNLGLPKNRDEWTPKLITDVLMRALEMIDDMRISHSAYEAILRPSVGDFLERKEGKELPPRVRGSPEALTSVFANLCENSVKYRQPGKPIRIEIDFEFQPTHFVVKFRDYGIGILAGEEERIFTRGYRTPRARDFVVRGNGLGLTWCREVLEHFGGGISAKRHEDGLEMIVRLSRA
jgi:hypothetical protein